MKPLRGSLWSRSARVWCVVMMCLWASPAWASDDEEMFDSEEYRAQRLLLHTSLLGPVGGLKVIDAGAGAVGSFRMSLGFQMFWRDEWPQGRDLSQIGGGLMWSWTPADHLEVFANATRWDNTVPDLPSSFQVVGNLALGLKWFYPVLDWLMVGVDGSASLPLNTNRETGLVMQSVGFGPRLSVTADLRNVERDMSGAPVLLRLNVGYWFENQRNLFTDLERGRYDDLPDQGPDARAPFDVERRHRATREERLALMVDRVDRLSVGVGVEVPLEARRIRTTFSPMAEWTMHVPIDRQGASCVAQAGLDPCISEAGAGAWRQSVLAGVRILPPLFGLSFYTGLEVGLSGVNRFAHELYPQAPWTFMFGLGYVHDYKTQGELLKKAKERRP